MVLAMKCCVPDGVELKLTQADIVKFVGRNDGESGINTYWLDPLKLNAEPIFPAVVVLAPFWNEPGLPSTLSLAFPSPFQRLTAPEKFVVDVPTVTAPPEMISVPAVSVPDTVVEPAVCVYATPLMVA